MSPTARTIYAYGCYSLILGIVLLLMQDNTLTYLQFLPSDEHWVYVIGILLISQAYIYLSFAKSDYKPFFKMSLVLRFWLVVALVSLVLLSLAPIPLLSFAGIDAFTALWTFATGRKVMT